ncbi:MAG: hypothetical protein HC798_03015 [Polaribacter sp.]|nr:hypothetical protein [Polaribacter sp.]
MVHVIYFNLTNEFKCAGTLDVSAIGSIGAQDAGSVGATTTAGVRGTEPWNNLGDLRTGAAGDRNFDSATDSTPAIGDTVNPVLMNGGSPGNFANDGLVMSDFTVSGAAGSPIPTYTNNGTAAGVKLSDNNILNATINSPFTMCSGVGGSSGPTYYQDGGAAFKNVDIVRGQAGRGGGSVVVRCKKYDFTGTMITNGTNATDSTLTFTVINVNNNQSVLAGVAGSSGGSAGCVLIETEVVTNDTGTYTMNGGTSGIGAAQFAVASPGGQSNRRIYASTGAHNPAGANGSKKLFITVPSI